jgi:hypothetical protein
MFELPNIEGDLPQNKHVIYFSCDDVYYVEYGIPLIKSIIKQIPWITVHCHLMLRDGSISLFKHKRVTYTYERVTNSFIESIPKPKIMKYGQQKDPLIVYYACARFLHIDKLFQTHQHVLQIDCDSLLFNPFPQEAFEVLTNTVKCMRKPKAPDKIIASAISLGTGIPGQKFREELALKLYKQINEFGAYWFVDQDVLQDIFNNSDYASMPMLWNTWSFKKKDAYFRTGKGDKKDTVGIFKTKLRYWKNSK